MLRVAAPNFPNYTKPAGALNAPVVGGMDTKQFDLIISNRIQIFTSAGTTGGRKSEINLEGIRHATQSTKRVERMGEEGKGTREKSQD